MYLRKHAIIYLSDGVVPLYDIQVRIFGELKGSEDFEFFEKSREEERAHRTSRPIVLKIDGRLKRIIFRIKTVSTGEIQTTETDAIRSRDERLKERSYKAAPASDIGFFGLLSTSRAWYIWREISVAPINHPRKADALVEEILAYDGNASAAGGAAGRNLRQPRGIICLVGHGESSDIRYQIMHGHRR